MNFDRAAEIVRSRQYQVMRESLATQLQVINMQKEASAVDTLKKLASQNEKTSNAISTHSKDPALSGAIRDKNVLRLGIDPDIEDKAREAADLKLALADAEARFAIVQKEIRQYGSDKRQSYNETFKTCVTSVSVPYSTGEFENGQPGVKHVTVVFTNRHTVNPDVANHKPSLGPAFDRLFVEKRSKTLKPNAEHLMRGLLGELGLSEKDVDQAMQVLFDERVSIATSKNYESEEQKLPDELKAILSQFVRKTSPSIRF
jgi:hypothetical protein